MGNVEHLTGKHNKIVDVMEKGKVKTACPQKAKWKGKSTTKLREVISYLTLERAPERVDL